MRPIEKRVVDDPRNNIATRELAIKQVKKMRNGARSSQEKRDLNKLIDRLESEIQAILEKANEDAETPEQTKPKKTEKTPEEIKAIMDRLNKMQEKFNKLYEGK